MPDTPAGTAPVPLAHPIRRQQRRACLRPPTHSPASAPGPPPAPGQGRPPAAVAPQPERIAPPAPPETPAPRTTQTDLRQTPRRQKLRLTQPHRRTRQGRPTPPAARRDMVLHTIRVRRTPQRLPLAPRLLPQAPRPTPGRRLRKPVARRRLAAVAALQPKAALQHRYPLDKTRPLLPKRRILRLQARNLLLQTPGYRHRHRQRPSLRAAPAHVKVHPCSEHTPNPQTIESIPGSHAMSCFVCVRRMSCGCFGHSASLRAERARYSVRSSRSGVFGMSPSFQRRFVPSAPPPAPGAAEPFSARIARARACAWPRALRGGAVRAPDCACARVSAGAGHTSPISFPKVFSRRRETGSKAAPRTPPSSCPTLSRICRSQAGPGIISSARRRPQRPGSGRGNDKERRPGCFRAVRRAGKGRRQGRQPGMAVLRAAFAFG